MNDLEMSIIKKTYSHIANTRHRYKKLMPDPDVTHPIPYFGRLSNAKVLTLGLNPSSKEFSRNRNWPQSDIPEKDLCERLCGYFDSVNPPPHKYFTLWSRALVCINASYKNDAAHLDLSARATRAAGQFGSDPLLSLFTKMLQEDAFIWLEAIKEMKSLEIILAAGSATKKYFINEFIKSELSDINVRLEGNWRRGVGAGQTACHILILPNGRRVPMFFCSTGPAARTDAEDNDHALINAVRIHALEINKCRIKAKDDKILNDDPKKNISRLVSTNVDLDIHRIDDMEKDDYFCPMPIKWNAIYTSLLTVWEKQGKRPGDKPPVPIILAAWHHVPGLIKRLQWKETIAWADRHECSHMIPKLADREKFRG